MSAKLENSAVAKIGKDVFIPKPKNVQTTTQSHSLYILVRLCSKSFRLVCEPRISDVKAGLRKGRGTREQILNILLDQRKQRDSRKTSTSA